MARTYDTHTYFAITAAAPPVLQCAPPAPPAADLDERFTALCSSVRHLGPVGTLTDEHLFAVALPSTDPPSATVRRVAAWLEGQPGVQHVEVLIPRQRSKRL